MLHDLVNEKWRTRHTQARHEFHNENDNTTGTKNFITSNL